jgi:hypothetical protein
MFPKTQMVLSFVLESDRSHVSTPVLLATVVRLAPRHAEVPSHQQRAIADIRAVCAFFLRLSRALVL